MNRTIFITAAVLLSASAFADEGEAPALDMVANGTLADFRAVAGPVAQSLSLSRSDVNAQHANRVSLRTCGEYTMERGQGWRAIAADYGEGCTLQSGPLRGQHVSGALEIERARGGDTAISFLGFSAGPHTVDGFVEGTRSYEGSSMVADIAGEAELTVEDNTADVSIDFFTVRNATSVLFSGTVEKSGDMGESMMMADMVEMRTGTPCGVPASGMLTLAQGDASIQIDFLGEGMAEVTVGEHSEEVDLCTPPAN